MSDVTLKALLLGDDRSASRAMKGVAREVDGVIDRLAVLGAMHPRPEVRLEAAKARAELDALTAKMTAAGAETEKLGKKADGTHKQLGAMATAIVALGPALVPLAAGATGLAAGWGAMGAAGVLAIVGIRNEMKAGTTIGAAYTAGVNTLKGDLNKLGAVAASGVLAPFEQTVANLQRRMPALTQQVGDFSAMTGKTAGNVTNGLVAAFMTLAPLERDVATYTLHLSQQFETLMSGPGIVSFGSYVQSVLPSVEATLGSLVTTTAHLVAAFAPLGGGTLSMLRVLSDLIGAIPVNVLSTMATLGGSVFLGFRTWQGLQPVIKGVSSALDFMKVSEEGVATAARGMTAAFGVIGVAVGVLSLLMTNNAESQRTAQQATDDYTEALRRSNGVINESIRKVAYDTLLKNGAVDAAKQLGVGLDDLTLAATGNADAQARVNAVYLAAKKPGSNLFDVADKLHGALSANNTELANAVQGYKDEQIAVGQSATAHAALGTIMGVSIASYQAAVTAQQQQATAAAQATVQMQLENDAAGLLKQTFDKLNGKALSAADAQNAFDSSLANMGDHMTATGKKIHFTTTSIGDMSAASVALRGQLNGQVHNLQGVIEANGGLSNSTAAAKAQYAKMRQQIIDNAVAHGVDRKAVEAYLAKLVDVNNFKPKPTQLDINVQGLADLRAADSILHSLSGFHAAVATRGAANRAATGRAAGGPVPGFAGGTLVGPGTGTSDSILAMVAQTGRLVRLSTGEFVSTASSTSRNQSALEAGNRGARLAVAGSGARRAGAGATVVAHSAPPGHSGPILNIENYHEGTVPPGQIAADFMFKLRTA